MKKKKNKIKFLIKLNKCKKMNKVKKKRIKQIIILKNRNNKL